MSPQAIIRSRFATFGHAVFAATLVALGAVDLVRGAFGPLSIPVPRFLVASRAAIYVCALIPVVAGLGLLWRRTATAASGLAAGYFSAWLLWRVSQVVYAPSVATTWPAGRTSVLAAAALVLLVRFRVHDRQGQLPLPSAFAARVLASVLFGLGQIVFGIAHFVFLDHTAALVPSWLPAPRAWAYFTGITFVAAGVAALAGACARLAIVLAAWQTGLFLLLVWGPTLAGSLTQRDKVEIAVSAVLTAAAWVVAEAFRGTPWFSWRWGKPRKAESAQPR